MSDIDGLDKMSKEELKRSLENTNYNLRLFMDWLYCRRGIYWQTYIDAQSISEPDPITVIKLKIAYDESTAIYNIMEKEFFKND